MSTGALGSLVAETFLNQKGSDIDKLYYISTKLSRKPRISSDKLECITIESTQDLLDELTRLLTAEHIDIVIHSAAVGDYKALYTIRAEDLIDELMDAVPRLIHSDEFTKEALMKIFESPAATCNDETKISSYEPHLMTMMTLTPKVIGSIKRISPSTTLVGFKLLEGVSKEELFEVAYRLREKNDADYIVANDLAKIGGGKHWAMIVGKNGIETECQTKQEIADTLAQMLL